MAEMRSETDVESVHAVPTAGAIVGGRYRVVVPIGSGGMGVVVKALRLADEALVAIKFLRTEASRHWNRFVREAETARMLEGPHIARVLDTDGLSAAPPYIVFELLEGETLAEIAARRGRLSTPEVLSLALQTSEALEEAHARGVVHRDIKPANLFVVNRGGAPFVKVLDFGISKNETESGQDVALTTTSTVIGSPSYASPEQLTRPRTVDHRTDIWSLGVTLYTLLTGEVPFPGETAPEVHSRVLGATPPPVSALVPGLSPDLDAVIHRCLEKEAAQRFQSVADLRAALEELGNPRRGKASTNAGRAWYVAGLAGLVVSVTAVAATVAFTRHGHPLDGVRSASITTTSHEPPSETLASATILAAPAATTSSAASAIPPAPDTTTPSSASPETAHAPHAPDARARAMAPPAPAATTQSRTTSKATKSASGPRTPKPTPKVLDPADHR